MVVFILCSPNILIISCLSFSSFPRGGARDRKSVIPVEDCLEVGKSPQLAQHEKPYQFADLGTMECSHSHIKILIAPFNPWDPLTVEE